MLQTRALVFLTILLAFQKVFSQNSTNCSAEWSVTADLVVEWEASGLGADVEVHVTALTHPAVKCLVSAEKRVTFSDLQVRFNDTVDLCPNSQYNIIIILNCTEGNWTDETTVWTTPGGPEDLTVNSTSSSSLLAEWTAPYGPIDLFTIFLDDMIKNVSETQFTFLDLAPYTSYAVSVSACHLQQCGPRTNPVIARTLSGLPSPPQIQPIIASNTSALIQWKEPEPFVGPILEYEFRWRTKYDMWMNSTVLYNNSHAMYDLSPYTWFDVEVRAITEGGIGNWSSDTFRTEAGIPKEPRNLNVTEITSTSITLEWEDPEPSMGPIIVFEVLWEKCNSSRYEHNKNSTVEKNFIMKDLQPFSNYSIKVRSKTSAGFGAWSEDVVAETAEDVPNEPRDLQTIEVTNETIWVEWKDPEPPTGTILSYVVRWKKVDDIVEGFQEDSTLDNYFVLEDLQPYSNYSIQVRGETSAGFGLWSEELVEETEIGVPHPPWDLKATDISTTSIFFKWKEANISTGPVIDYSVHLLIMDNRIFTRNISTEKTYCLIESLLPYTSYIIKVRARTAVGFSDWSDELIVETDIGFPLPPVHLSATSTSNTSLTLEWLDAKPSHGPILDYVLEWGRMDESGRQFEDDIVDRTYTLFNLDPYTNYSIRVRARTEAGYGNWTMKETFQTDIGIPSEPLNLTLVLSTNTSLKFQWEAPAKPNGPLLPYEISWRMLNDGRPSVVYESNDLYFERGDLLPYTFYSIRVAARTTAGSGEYSETLEVQTDVGIPAPALLDVIEVEDSRTIIVPWKVQGTQPGPTEYELQVWKNLGPCSGNRILIAKNLDGRVDWILGKHRTKVADLVPHTRYFFKVVLKTKAGQRESEYSDNVWTNSDVPGSPQDVMADCDSSPTEARVCWKPPKDPNGEIYEYILQYADEDVSRSLHIHVDNACSDQSILLKKLRPERPYTISVKTKVKDVATTSPAAKLQQECVLPAGVPPVSETSILRVKSGNEVKSLFIEWSQDTFSDAMGTLLKYAVLVGTSEAIGNLSSSGQDIEDVVIPTWKNFTDGFSDFYQATPVEWNPFERNTDAEDPLKCEVLETEEWPNHNITVLRCAVGLQEDCSGYDTYCNGPLVPDTAYAMKLRAFTRGGYADTHLLLARTGSYPKPSMGVGIIIGIIVCLLILIFMAGIFTYRKRSGMDPLMKAFETRFGNRTEPDAPLSLTLKEYQTKGKVPVEKFPEHVRVMMLDSQLKFSQEFEKLKRDSQQLPCTVAEMEENRPKNRWMNIFPFDHSRVKLLPLGDEPGSDFINANYIPGTSSLREYIATQGPLATTVDDFWRMIWEQSVTTIVMLTQCVERGKSKCEEYWPPPTQGGAHYGDLLVRTISVSMLDSYVIRIFRVQLGTRDREVKQLHFTRWPDFGCPESPEELINFVRAVRDHLPRILPGPIIVHCSAGVGRTGTFIAVDRIAQELKDTNHIDVYGTVMDLRQHRTNMVQTEDQYVYIHRCVLQLLLERSKPVGEKYEDVIYSNIGAHVTGV